MTLLVSLHDVAKVESRHCAMDNGTDCSSLKITGADGSAVTIFMPFDLADAMAAAYAEALIGKAVKP